MLKVINIGNNGNNKSDKMACAFILYYIIENLFLPSLYLSIINPLDNTIGRYLRFTCN